MNELLDLPLAGLADQLGSTTRAHAVWRSLRAGDNPFVALPPRARARLAGVCVPSALSSPPPRLAADGTRRWRVVLRDGAAVETVLIPTPRRSTVCVSTQVGCARGCIFCVTATMGRIRDLAAGEIVAQVLLARRYAAATDLPAVRNVVLMGMGEPLDNLEATRRAVGLLTDPAALGLAQSHVTLSTVGPSPRSIAALLDMPARLAWSLHAVDDDARRRLVPTTRHSVSELRDAFVALMRQRRDSLFVEITLIHGVNDSAAHADALAEFLVPLPRTRINLLPLNPGRPGLAPSPPATAERFQERLRARGWFCTLRKARGADVDAACGQLAARQEPGRC